MIGDGSQRDQPPPKKKTPLDQRLTRPAIATVAAVTSAANVVSGRTRSAPTRSTTAANTTSRAGAPRAAQPARPGNTGKGEAEIGVHGTSRDVNGKRPAAAPPA